jgi:hypothetical protein
MVPLSTMLLSRSQFPSCGGEFNAVLPFGSEILHFVQNDRVFILFRPRTGADKLLLGTTIIYVMRKHAGKMVNARNKMLILQIRTVRCADDVKA